MPAEMQYSDVPLELRYVARIGTATAVRLGCQCGGAPQDDCAMHGLAVRRAQPHVMITEGPIDAD
jgi:hypothetical protein